MAGQGRHCGPVTTRVEALVRALSAAVLLDSGPLLPCPCWVLPTSVAEQGTGWGGGVMPRQMYFLWVGELRSLWGCGRRGRRVWEVG